MILNIQALRGLAALMVVFVHLNSPLLPLGDYDAALEFGNAGVDLFFIISGFILIHTTFEKQPSAGAMLLGRLTRIVPLYWAVTLFVFALAIVAPAAFQSTRPDIGALLKSLLFVAFEREDGKMVPLYFLGWTLNYEVAFYLIFALAIAIVGRRPAAVAAVASTVLTTLVIAGWVLRPSDAVVAFYTAPILLEFVVGMGLGLLHRSGAVLPVKLSTAALLVGVPLLFGHRLLGLEPHGIAVIAIAGVIVAGAVGMEAGGRICRNRWVLLIGAASYVLYLVHPFVLQAGAQISKRSDSPALIIAITVLTMLVALPIAILIHLWIEKPVTRWLRGRIDPRDARPASEAQLQPS